MIVLQTLILLLATGISSAGADASILQDNKCNQCHRLSANEENPNLAPDLFYAGDKFQETWLRDFLRKPSIIRSNGYSGRKDFPNAIKPEAHPALSEKDAEAVADKLLALRLKRTETSMDFGEPLSRGKKVRAKILFERNYSCSACHKGVNLAGKPRGGVSGPSLFNAGARLKPQWIYNWLLSPELYRKKGRMPRYKLDNETAVKLVQYIMTLKKDGLK